jgi:hypothetical protein
MDIFKTKLDQVDEAQLRDFLKTVNNESRQIEFKSHLEITDHFKFELLRDVVSFANSSETGLIFYGVTNSKELFGIPTTKTTTGDKYQNHIISWLDKNVVPDVLFYVEIQPISLASNNFALILRINPPNLALFGIKHHKKLDDKTVFAYEFWTRASGNKRQRPLESILDSYRIQLEKLQIHPKIRNAYSNLKELLFFKDNPIPKDDSNLRRLLQYFQENKNEFVKWTNFYILSRTIFHEGKISVEWETSLDNELNNLEFISNLHDDNKPQIKYKVYITQNGYDPYILTQELILVDNETISIENIIEIKTQILERVKNYIQTKYNIFI